jgi:hypothetical protein
LLFIDFFPLPFSSPNPYSSCKPLHPTPSSQLLVASLPSQFFTYLRLLWSFGYPKEMTESLTSIVFCNSKTTENIKDGFEKWYGHVETKAIGTKKNLLLSFQMSFQL